MSRAASSASVEFDPQEPAAMARSSSLSNDNSTSVSVGSPKRSLLDMSRAVSEQLHLTSAGKGVQRPFLADLQQRWTAGHQVGTSFFLTFLNYLCKPVAAACYFHLCSSIPALQYTDDLHFISHAAKPLELSCCLSVVRHVSSSLALSLFTKIGMCAEQGTGAWGGVCRGAYECLSTSACHLSEHVE